MRIRLSHSSNVIGLFSRLDTRHINDYFKDSLKKIELLIDNEDLKDWELDFNCLYGNGTHIHVAKSTKPYVKDKQKIIGIGIPIPTIDVVAWGVNHEQHIADRSKPGSEKYYTALEMDFKESMSLVDHIVQCVKTGISFALSDGITILGNKVKVQGQLFG